ncbi:MAG TPA: tetratricopeptide repeat protein [Ferruginibacter sp.]|nr:tetratricopeptide repeat protein [Ferruginibacter sp.]
MKHTLLLLSVLCCLAACNHASDEQVNESSSIVPAEKMMKDAIQQFPDSVLLKENLIQYYRDSGYFDKAIATTGEALKKDSNNARLWDIKATLHFENGDTINATRSLEKAVQIMPDPGYVMSLGSLYAQTKNIKALELADLLLINKQTNTAKEGFFIKGIYYTAAGDKNKAISYFDKSLLLDYTFMFAYREKAIALYDLGKYEEALKVLNKSITLQNNFDEGYYWRGRCLEKLNKSNEAIEEYRTALLYSPDFVEAKEALARLGAK